MRGDLLCSGLFALVLGAAVSVFAIASPNAAAGPLAAAPAIRNSLLVLAADAGAGKAVFESHCAVCHTVGAGQPNKFGPNLHGVVGREAGSLPGYNYSSAMKGAGAAGLKWTATTLDIYLKNPHHEVPGNKMPFPGLPSETQRQNLIAFLSQASK